MKALKIAKGLGKNAILGIVTVVLVVVLAVTAGIVFFIIKPVCDGAEGIGIETGKLLGKQVAMAVEPFRIPFDAAKGAMEGYEAGVSAEDTSVESSKTVETLGSGILEVFTADVTIHDVQTQGEPLPTGPYYAALYEYKGKLIFSVDLNNVDIRHNGSDVIITVPKPDHRLVIDESKTTPVAVYQSIWGYIGTSPNDGIDSTMNSRNQLMEKSAEELEDYPELLAAAQEEAIKQIRELAEAVIIDKSFNVKVGGE